MMKGFLVFALLLLQCTCCVHSARHPIIDRGVDGHIVSSSGFIVEPNSQNWPQRDLNWRSTSSCKETYGFMPCTTSTVGNLFLLLVYGYLMYVAGHLLTKGRDVVLTGHLLTKGRDIIGVFLPMVGSLSDIALILVFGLFGSKEIAQGKLMVGMGFITGSTVMLLTAFWGACLIAGTCDIRGRCDIQQCNLCASGITVDDETAYMSRIMVVSFVPFCILALRGVIHSSSNKRIMDLVASITAIIFLLSYYIYQFLRPWISKRRETYAQDKQIIASILKVVPKKGLERLLQDDDKLDEETLLRIFKILDADKDGHLSRRELRGFILGLELQDPQTTTDNVVDKIMKEFDSSRDDQLSQEEFTDGIRVRIPTSTVGHSDSKTKEKNDEEEVVKVDNLYKVYVKAVLLMLGGFILAAISADPYVDAVGKFSEATSIPSFFLSFIILPLATKAAEGIAALKKIAAFKKVSEKKTRSASLTYSEIYGAVIINNTFCLAEILGIAYFRGLDWDFSAEVQVTLLAVLASSVLLVVFSSKAYKLWKSVIAIILYPLCLYMFYKLGDWS